MCPKEEVSAEYVQTLMKKGKYAKIRELAAEGHQAAQNILNERSSAATKKDVASQNGDRKKGQKKK